METENNSENPTRQRYPGLAKAGMALALGVLVLTISMQMGWLPDISDMFRRGTHMHIQADELPPPPGRVPDNPPPPSATDMPSPPRLADLPPPPPPPAVADREVYVIVEQMPELIGGLGALQKIIRYPAIAKMAGVQGRVFVQFIVDEEGKVTDPVVVRGIGAGCDEEAIRALREMNFVPGRQKGHAVRVKMSIPVTYRLN